MSVYVEVSKDGGTATASNAAIAEGRFLARASNTTVVQASAATDYGVGVAASAAAANGSVRVFLPGQVCRLQAGADLNPATDAHTLLTSDADGKAAVAAQGNRIMAIWLRAVGEDPAADDFITALITDQATIHP